LLALPEALTARRLGLPVVLQVHEVPQPGAKRQAALKLAARAANVVACVSEAAAEPFRTSAARQPVYVVRNGVPPIDVPRFHAAGRPFTVGTVGTVSRTKGTDLFLRGAALALERRPALRFDHVGQRNLHEDTALDTQLDMLLRQTTLREATTFHGRLDALTALGSMDLFVLPSRSEAFPLATLEAMSAGVPVVATRVGGLPEQIEHLREGILVPPENPAALAAAIVRAYDDPVLRARLSEAAAARVRREFTLARQAAGLHHAYLTASNLRFGPPQARRRADALQ
jgi:glycosyltransferase involved in cell wall biosynthesis